jgi:hypothetical protein
MDQREKARDFLRKEGHGNYVKDVNVGRADKSKAKHPHHLGVADPARTGQAYAGAEADPADGLLRGHVKDV